MSCRSLEADAHALEIWVRLVAFFLMCTLESHQDLVLSNSPPLDPKRVRGLLIIRKPRARGLQNIKTFQHGTQCDGGGDSDFSL